MFSRLLKAGQRASNKSLFAYSVVGGVTAASGLANFTIAAVSDEPLHPPHQHWTFKGVFGTYDSASMRRGYEVYRNVCSTCHSMDSMHFRELVGVTHTKEQATKLAASYDIEDGPNDEGDMFERPGKLSDHFRGPYRNPEEGRASNGGALPPDLSVIAKARHNGPDYIMALLTGYSEPASGMVEKPGLHFNPYFPGYYIAMAPPLEDGQVEYEDGTEATVSQMAKDVVEFLTWAAEPENDIRKATGVRAACYCAALALVIGYQKRFFWGTYKTRKLSWIDRPTSA